MLKERHTRAVALCRKVGTSCAELRGAAELHGYNKGLTAGAEMAIWYVAILFFQI